MPKSKILKKRANSLRNTRTRKKKEFDVKKMKPIKLKTKKGITPFDPDKILSDKNLAAKAIFESFIDNDPDTILEIIDAYVRTVNKVDFADKTGIARSTLYDMLEGRRNPTLRVLTQCIREAFS